MRSRSEKMPINTSSETMGTAPMLCSTISRAASAYSLVGIRPVGFLIANQVEDARHVEPPVSLREGVSPLQRRPSGAEYMTKSDMVQQKTEPYLCGPRPTFR